MITTLQAIEKIKRYCAYQERCQYETRCKLREWGIEREKIEQIIAELISEGYINEERFARSFARGKFNIKSWGVQKIISELKRRNISESCINRAMEEIDNNLYFEKLNKLAFKWLDTHKLLAKEEQKQKIFRFLSSKGYEYEDIWNCINNILK